MIYIKKSFNPTLEDCRVARRLAPRNDSRNDERYKYLHKGLFRGKLKLMSKSRGFTLIELMVVISIIAILSVIGIAMYGNALKSARDSRRQSDLYHIQEALEQYYTKFGSYPMGSSQSDLDCWKNNSLSPSCPLYGLISISNGFLKSVPIDPGTNNDGGTCGTVQVYKYVSTNGAGTVDYSAGACTTDCNQGYRLGATIETKGTSECLNAADNTPKCGALQQYCITNKQ